MTNDQVYRECGDGWKSLIDPLVSKANELGATVDQIKEKYGGLRFYFTPGEADADELEEMIEEAEIASQVTCELCGAPGHTLHNGPWYKTLCKEHALELGYKDLA
jgi:hypothetical protein